MSDTSFSLGRLSRIKEVTDADVRFGQDRAMRVYSMSPEASVVQIRVNGPITESGKGTPRQMIATAVLDEDGVRRLRDLLDQELLRLGDNRAREAA